MVDAFADPFPTTPDTSWPPTSGYVLNTPEYPSCSHVQMAQYTTLINTSLSTGYGIGTRSSFTCRSTDNNGTVGKSPAKTKASFNTVVAAPPGGAEKHGSAPRFHAARQEVISVLLSA